MTDLNVTLTEGPQVPINVAMTTGPALAVAITQQVLAVVGTTGWTISPTAPPNPAVGDVWVDIS